MIDKFEKRGTPVAGIIIEPIQGEGGDNFASAEFFQSLQDLTEEVQINNVVITVKCAETTLL